MDQFVNEAIEAGFTRQQAEFMSDMLAKYPHSHSVSEVEGLEELLDDMEEEGEEDGDNED